MQTDIIIEIGTEVEKGLIHSELNYFLNLLGEKIITEINLTCICVPFNFDNKVNELQQTKSYQSSRGSHLALAKIIDAEDNNNYIILSPYLYTDIFNSHIRFHIISHEIYHLINRTRFEIPEYDGTARIRYIATMMTLYDEYSANRFSHKLINAMLDAEKDPKITEFISNYFYAMYKGHLEPLQDSSKYYDVFIREINAFRLHGDIMRFLKNVSDLFDEVSKNIIYLFSYADEFNFIYDEFKNIKSVNFLNENTYQLMQTYQEWYPKKKSFDSDIETSIDKIKAFVCNFGMLFEDTENGEYCHVLDI
jgi:hypothetical protein